MKLLLPLTLAILVYLYFRARGETRKPVTWDEYAVTGI